MQSRKNILKHPLTPVFALLTIALVWRVVFLFTGAALLDSDESIEGIMAQRILRGEFEIYFIDQHYLGRVENYPLALFFALTGLDNPLGMKIFAMMISAAFVLTLYYLSKTLYSDTKIAFFIALFAAASPATFTLWSMKIRDFVTCLVLGQLIMLLAAKICAQEQWSKRLLCAWIGLGFLMGLELYHYILVAPYLALAVMILLINPFRRLLTAELKQPLQLCLLTPLLALICVLVYQGTGVMGQPLSQPVYRNLALALFTYGAILFAAGLILNLKNPRRFNLPLVWFLLAFAIGFSPAIYDAATAADLWYKNTPTDLSRTVTIIYTSLVQNVPYLFGTMASPSALSAMHFDLPDYSPEWFNTIYSLLIVLIIGCFLYVTIRWGNAAIERKDRRNNFYFLLLIGIAYAQYCASGPVIGNTRHLLPLYTGIFVILGFICGFFYRYEKRAGIALALLLLAIFGFYNFRHRLADVSWPGYYRPEIAELQRLMEENDLQAAYCDDSALCHELQLALGPDYALATNFRMLRYKDKYETLRRSNDFALILYASQEHEYEIDRLVFKRTRVGRQTFLYDFRFDGSKLEYDVLTQLISSQ